MVASCVSAFLPAARRLVFSNALPTALLHQDLSFYPSMVWWALALHTHTTWFPSPPSSTLGRCPCSVKLRPCVIPDVTCIILVHTTNTADKTTTTPLLDSTLSPCPPPVDHRGDPLSHTFNIDQDFYLPHICCIQHRLGYLPVSDSSLSDSSLSNSFFI